MIKILLLLPSSAGEGDIKKTLQSIEEAQLLEREDTTVYLYCEKSIPNSIASLFTWRFTKDNLSNLTKLLCASAKDDVVIPLFMGDTVPVSALLDGIDLIETKDYVTVYSTAKEEQKENLSYLNLIKYEFFNLDIFVNLLKQSCFTLADNFKNCIKDTEDFEIVYVEDEIKSVCQQFSLEKVQDVDKRYVWAFCAGQYSNDFRGNPKYLFLYLNYYRFDIQSYWLCDNEAVLIQVRQMGMMAYRSGTKQAELMINRTGVLVSEQVKATIPKGLEDAIYLNLWHGVGGVKAVERSLVEGRLAEEIAKKYIQHNTYYRTNEMYLAPSDFIEEIAKEQLGLSEQQIIHSGYPRNLYQKNCKKIETFNHTIFKHISLPEDVRFAAYIPTYRNNQKGDLFAAAIADMEKLIQVCEQNHICMIFKMHPLLEKELSFQQAKETYKDCPWVYFWDNSNDFYEVLDQIDLCIFDYSSMFTDFIAAGCKYYLRYAFDFTASDLEFPLDYEEATLGQKCTTFDELMLALNNYAEQDLEADILRISNLYWQYSTLDSMDKIADDVLAFCPIKQNLPTLYSFDIFDTLISRKVLAPEGIFYRVQERIRESKENFPSYLIKRYPFIRRNAERNMREYYNRSIVERDDERCEIQFAEIMKRIQVLYNLTEEQTSLLSQWEIEAELENVIPLEQTIALVKKLVSQNETVILISDMYLPKDVIQSMLAKADPMLASLPLYLSSELGYQKSAKTLYLEVYRQYAPDYRFGRWIHTGDNLHSDIKCPRSYNIETVTIQRLEFNTYEEALVKELQSYDGYLIAASMARFRAKHTTLQEQFVYSFISLLFVPYVHWAMHSCKEQGKQNVYLISRDGHQLKKIADVVNEIEQLELNVKYLYASRRVWRIPSFFDHIDVGFWGQGYGNIAKVNRFSKLLKALDMEEETFREMFPELSTLNEQTVISEQEIVRLADIFKNSEKYLQYLLNKAAEERYPTCEYLKQEMDLNIPYAIIEYWGRGYTQENFTRLWQYVCGRKEPTTFYYSRSTLPSDEDNIRMNFTSHPSSQAFIESIFACINYKTVENYERINGKWTPVTEEIICDQDLFYAMERYLSEFTKEYCTLPLTDRETTGRSLIDFAISWYAEHPEWEGFTEVLAKLVDSVEMYGNKTVFAKELTMNDLSDIVAGKTRGQISKNISISYYQAEKEVQQRFLEMFQIREGEDLNSGYKITDASIEKNKRARQELVKRRKTQTHLQRVYDETVKKSSLEKKIILVTQGDSFEEQAYGSILEALDSQMKYMVEKLCIKNCKLSLEMLIEKIATVEVILTVNPMKQLSGIKLRPETKLIILGDTPVQFFYTGLLRKEGLRDVKDLMNFDLMNDISVIQTPSEAIAERAREIYSIGTRTQILTNGSCITDCYFNAELRNSLKEKFFELYPEAVGRKIISYLPLHRYRNTKSKYAQLLDFHQMQKALGEEYFIILHLMDAAKDMINEVEIPNFSVNLAKEFSIRAQMLLADIIIADYRDTSFEAPLAGVPTFVTCSDKLDYSSKDNIFCSFDEMMFGVPIRNTEELIEQLQHIELYDDTNRKNFINTYLTNCDGMSAKRLVEYILEDTKELFTLPDIGELRQEQSSIKVQCPIIEITKSLDGIYPVLYWNPVPDAEIYEVLESNQVDGQFNVIGQVKADSCVYRIKNIEEFSHWYCVRALYQNGTILGPCSEPVHGIDIKEYVLPEEDANSLSIEPEIWCIIPSKKGNRLYWNGEGNVAGWRVRCYYKDGTMRQEDLLQVNTWEWTDRDGKADEKATYMMSALYWLSNGELKEGKQTELQKVNKVCSLEPTVRKFLRGRFVLTWKPENDVMKYHIYRREDVRGIYYHVAELGRGKLEYTEHDKNSGVVNYIIIAETEDGFKVCKPIKLCVPEVLAKPTGLSVKRTEEGNCLLWNTMPEIDGWNIRLYNEEYPSGKKIMEIPKGQTWWTDTENSEEVSYAVEAVRNVGEGSQFSGYCKAVKVQKEN